MNDFFAFRTMLFPVLMKLLYPLGMLALSAVGAFTIAAAFTAIPAPFDRLVVEGGWPAGALVLVAGNLAWRLVCEQAMVFFAIHEALVRGAGGDKPGKRK